ncbi:MAG: hypothetical protein GXP54_03155 [Deltaproteobacteria bacterium]|nr:hypothetical protein [Deltaproteobacteria bacterium]
MQDFLRRNFWIVNLVVIGCGAYLLAGVVTEFGATAVLSGTDRKTTSRSKPQPSGGALSIKPPSSGSLASTLMGRNPFDAEPKEVPEDEMAGTGDEGEGGLAQSDLAIDLLGTLVSDRPEWSMATIKMEGASKLVRIGVSLEDRAEVIEIAERYIILMEGNERKVVKLWDAKKQKRPDRGSRSPFRPVSSIRGRSPGNDFSKGVKKVGPHEYNIDRGMLEENLSDLTKLGMQARIIPNYVGGKYHGFRMVGIRPNSLYRAIGLNSGDLITRVNGHDIDTPNKAISLFEELRSSPTIALDIERRGRKVTLTYKVK